MILSDFLLYRADIEVEYQTLKPPPPQEKNWVEKYILTERGISS